MARAGRRLGRQIAAWVSILFGYFTRLLPLAVTRAMGSSLAEIAYRLVPRMRRVGTANLDLAYGDTLSRKAKQRILRGAVHNAVRVAAELSRLPTLSGDGWRRHIDVEGVEHIDPNRGAVLIGGHLGNWEWMPRILIAHGFRLVVVVRSFDAPVMDRYVNGLRRSAGIKTIPKDKAGAELQRMLGDGWLVGLLIDQSPRESALPVTFFGQPCWATIGPAMLALRTGAPIHPASMTRLPNGRYHLRFFPSIPYEVTGDTRNDLLDITQRCQDAIERMVREHPEQWLWFHRRWKERPRLSAEWTARQRDAQPNQ
ncbi:MAG TPA: lysophospholipid acyltransferase family protein [Candidatus Hydrogenedentes bacterium]|nr:lysophospholipid acyltransferase family protein [Candidatus Hydrogenedentota bacterium]HNT88332.1 lysophospholipid acyltransferase family protein [Candidatus Hydrogenedentota bacterium]